MEAPQRVLRRSAQRSKRCITIIVALVVAVVVAVVVSVAVTLTGKRDPRGLPTTILVPLYIYPDPGAWDPLFEAVEKHSDLNFTIIINPDNGPGESRVPSFEYTRQIQNLTQHPNVKPIGYVPIGYASRDIDEVLRDISRYAGWQTIDDAAVNVTALAMHGIFVDEAAYEYTSESAEYMDTITKAVKDAAGILEPKTVVRNPGTVPDPRFEDVNTDITVVFEQSFDLYQQLQQELTSLAGEPSSKSFIIHSVPADTHYRKLVDQLAVHAQHLFITDLTSNYYESFGDDWMTFVDSMTA